MAQKSQLRPPDSQLSLSCEKLNVTHVFQRYCTDVGNESQLAISLVKGTSPAPIYSWNSPFKSRQQLPVEANPRCLSAYCKYVLLHLFNSLLSSMDSRFFVIANVRRNCRTLSTDRRKLRHHSSLRRSQLVILCFLQQPMSTFRLHASTPKYHRLYLVPLPGRIRSCCVEGDDPKYSPDESVIFCKSLHWHSRAKLKVHIACCSLRIVCLVGIKRQ